MSGRCDTCGAPSAGLYELALIRVDEQMLDADAVACARMTALCPACRDRLAARVAALVPVWAGDGARNIEGPIKEDGFTTVHPDLRADGTRAPVADAEALP